MTTEQDHIRRLEETRQNDLNAMLLALLLIERGQIEEAKQALLERLPGPTVKLLLAKAT